MLLWSVNPLFIQMCSLWWKDRVTKNFEPHISSNRKVGREWTWLQARVHLRSAGVLPLFTICDVRILASRFTLRLRLLFSFIRHAFMKSRLFVLHTHFNTCPHFPKMSSLWQYNVNLGPHDRAADRESRFRAGTLLFFFPFRIHQIKHQQRVQTCNSGNWNMVVVNCAESKHHCCVFLSPADISGSQWVCSCSWMNVPSAIVAFSTSLK